MTLYTFVWWKAKCCFKCLTAGFSIWSSTVANWKMNLCCLQAHHGRMLGVKLVPTVRLRYCAQALGVGEWICSCSGGLGFSKTWSYFSTLARVTNKFLTDYFAAVAWRGVRAAWRLRFEHLARLEVLLIRLKVCSWVGISLLSSVRCWREVGRSAGSWLLGGCFTVKGPWSQFS